MRAAEQKDRLGNDRCWHEQRRLGEKPFVQSRVTLPGIDRSMGDMASNFGVVIRCGHDRVNGLQYRVGGDLWHSYGTRLTKQTITVGGSVAAVRTRSQLLADEGRSDDAAALGTWRLKEVEYGGCEASNLSPRTLAFRWSRCPQEGSCSPTCSGQLTSCLPTPADISRGSAADRRLLHDVALSTTRVPLQCEACAATDETASALRALPGQRGLAPCGTSVCLMTAAPRALVGLTPNADTWWKAGGAWYDHLLREGSIAP